MNQPTCRLVPFAVADGATNMATDEVMLQSAQNGVATLRFYGWLLPTLSLGYFQSEKSRLTDPRLADLPFVRRPSGGDTLVHHHEVTYALALPPGQWQIGGSWLVRMHQVIAAALSRLGIESNLCEPAEPGTFNGCLCFQHLTPGDLLVAESKVVGSAQRKRRGALLQHGGILLAQSQHTPELPGLLELTGKKLCVDEVVQAVRVAFANATGTVLMEQPLSADEQKLIVELKAEKYGTSIWNFKR